MTFHAFENGVTTTPREMQLSRMAARSLSNVRRSSYLRSIVTLSTGQLLAAVIPFLTAPILGRIYRPEDYAPLAAYVALVNVATAIATLQLQYGIVVEKTARRARQVSWLALTATFIVAILAIPVEIGADLLTSLPVIVAEHRVWFAALPFSVFVAGVSLTAMSLANRMQAYRLLAIMQFAAALVSALASIALGFLRLGAEGLLTAYIVSQFILLGFSLAILARFGVIAERPRVSTLRRLALRHRGYPFFTLPGQLMQSIGLQLPVLTLTMLGATASLGSFNRAQQILFLPLSLFSAAITRVHFQNAAADYNKHGNCRPVFIKTAFVISLFAIPFMLIVLFLGEPIFTLYLGRNWSEAGRIAEIICPVFALQMFVAPLGSSLLFTGNQRLSLYIQTVGLFIAIAATTFPIEFGFDDYQILTGWTAALSALACGQIYFGWRLAKAPMRTQFEGALNA